MKTWDEISKEMQSNGTPLSAIGYCRIAFMAGQASVDAASGYDAGVEACEPEILRLSEQVRTMKEAMQHFVDRVDAGEVRSKKTYAEFKAILAESV